MVPSANATIPSSTKHIYVSAAQLTEEGEIELLKANDMSAVPFEVDKATGILTPNTLEENTDYIVRYTAPFICGQMQSPATFPFRTTSSATEPATNITLPLTISEVTEKEVTYSPGDCNVPVKTVSATLSTTLPDTLKPWKNLLRWHIEANNQRFEAKDGVGDVYASCDVNNRIGASEGVHDVRLVATLIGTDMVWRSASKKVQLDCGDASSGCNHVMTQSPQSPGHLFLLFLGLLSARLWRKRS